MNKLELKHLAPYLPYGLKVFWHKDSDPVWMEISEGQLSHIIRRSTEYPNDNKWKPILRPLSDLCKLGYKIKYPTEHSINMLIGKNDNYGQVTLSEYKDKLSIDIESEDYSNNENIDYSIFLTIQEQLFKGHFDVFGLIPLRLAIDINTIKS
jgi:hypothetical protein